MLFAAIGDIQSSVQANDSKSSAALVVHGLLFAGIVNVVGRLGHVYDKANSPQRTIGLLLLAAALFAFLISVAFLLWAIRPYRPKGLDRWDHWYPGAFFPVPKDLRAEAHDMGQDADQLDAMAARVQQLDSGNSVDELAAEVVKLANILEHESSFARRGYIALYVEVFLASAFLALAALVAVS